MTPLVQYRLAGIGLVAVAMVLAGVAGVLDLDEQSAIDADTLTIDAPAYVVEPPVAAGATVPAPSPTVSSDPAHGVPAVVPVAPAAPAVRVGNATQVTPTEPPPAPPAPAGGDCAAWGDVLAWYGATPDEVAFFVPRILERETGCGRDTLNDSTGDSGICQLNPIHNRPGWFGGVEFGPGGWLGTLHGLTTRVDTDSTEWAAACLTLYRVCGDGPWSAGDYGCANRSLP